MVPTVTWPRDVFLGGGRMQHGGDGGDSEVRQFGSEICLQICRFVVLLVAYVRTMQRQKSSFTLFYHVLPWKCFNYVLSSEMA